MKYEIDLQYNQYSEAIILHLIRSSEEYLNLFISQHPDLEPQLSNFHENENCGCRPVILMRYKKVRFQIDLMTVKFINDNPDVINLTDFCSNLGHRNLAGSIFSIPDTEADFKDFLSGIKAKGDTYNGLNTLHLDNRILVTFF